LGTDDFDKIENQVLISKDKNELKIKSETESMNESQFLIYLEESNS
jgi:hypothetical protein